METVNQKRNRLLGEPFGTATSRLRKMLLFDFAHKLALDTCYRCELLIENIEDFSIEHTTSWQGSQNPRETFFDLSKIAFSHLSCNSRAGEKQDLKQRGIDRRKVGPVGTAWCWRHEEFLPLDRFSNNAGRWNGLKRECKDCDHYWRTPEKPQ